MALSADDLAAAYKSGGVYDVVAAEPLEDAYGHAWRDQHGQPMTLSDHVEALTGQRLMHRDSLFSGLGRRELAAPQRVTRFGDYDDPADPGYELSEASQLTMAALRDAMGLPDHAAAREQARDAAFDRLVQRPAQRHRTHGEALDYGEGTRERAGRYRMPVTAGSLAQVEGTEPLFGSLPGYTAVG
jgi:hypothetical protein